MQDINTALSIVGFGMSLFALIGVGSIKKKMKSKLRIPELATDIEGAGSRLNRIINSSPMELATAIREIDGVMVFIRNAKPHIPKSEREHVLRIDNRLKALSDGYSIHNSAVTKKKLLDAYSDIQTLATIMGQITKNSRID